MDMGKNDKIDHFEDTTVFVVETTTEEPHYSFSFWINGVLTMCLIVVGVVGNVAIILSLQFKTKKWLALYYYFMAFAVWNTALLASTIFLYCTPALRPDDRELGVKDMEDFVTYSIIAYGVANCGMTASIWLVLTLTVERYLAVCKPFTLIASKPKRRARVVVGVISCLAPIYNLPLFFELRAVRSDNGTVDVVTTVLRDNGLYKIAYRVLGNMIFLSIVPLLSIVVMSVRIVYVVRTLTNENRYNYFNENDQQYNLIEPSPVNRRRSSVSRCHTKLTQRSTHRTHLTLAALATKFVLCYTLPTLLNIMEIIAEPHTLTQMGIGAMVDVSNLMVVVDSALNGFLYFSWRRKIAIVHQKQTHAPLIKQTLSAGYSQQHSGLSPGRANFRREERLRYSARSVSEAWANEKMSSL